METPEKGGRTMAARIAPDVSVPAAAPVAPAWRGLGADRREITATARARRFGIALIAASSISMIALLIAAWLVVRSFF